ncbi:MAG: hypothetical protein FWE19_07655 [Oscillospiraceae bacterium]|nr:hypothetical protein [Oscillospiraceae bacterium]
MKKLCLIIAIALVMGACTTPTPTAPPPMAEAEEYVEYTEKADEGMPEPEPKPEFEPEPEPEPEPESEPEPEPEPEPKPEPQPQSQPPSAPQPTPEPASAPPVAREEPVSLGSADGQAAGPDIMILPNGLVIDLTQVPPPAIAANRAVEIAISHLGGGRLGGRDPIEPGRMFRDDGREVWTVGVIRGNDLFTIYVATDNGEIVYANHRNPPSFIDPTPVAPVRDRSEPRLPDNPHHPNLVLPAPPCVWGFGTYYSMPPAPPPNAVAVDD